LKEEFMSLIVVAYFESLRTGLSEPRISFTARRDAPFLVKIYLDHLERIVALAIAIPRAYPQIAAIR